jgi:DNA-directed RNA polymerase subunit N (RpoN/RPB10)
VFRICSARFAHWLFWICSRWENFINAVEKAKIACENAGELISDHFRDVTKMVMLGSGAQRELADIALTRYACYLIAQNGDAPALPDMPRDMLRQICNICNLVELSMSPNDLSGGDL